MESSTSGQKVAAWEVFQEKMIPAEGCASDNVVVDNNFLRTEQIDHFADIAKGCETCGDCGKFEKNGRL